MKKFSSYIKQSLEDGDFDSQVKRITQDGEGIRKSKGWDWMEFGKTYLVTNLANDIFFIYYGNQEGSFMWVAPQGRIWAKWDKSYSNVWKMNSNDGECWVMSYLELKLGDNFFLNWNKEPWGDLK